MMQELVNGLLAMYPNRQFRDRHHLKLCVLTAVNLARECQVGAVCCSLVACSGRMREGQS